MTGKTTTDWKKSAEAAAKTLLSDALAPRFFETLRPIFSALPPDTAPVGIACSGGADSLCALLLVWAKFPEIRSRLRVLHYDHAVRAESAADAEFVREVCRALDVEFISERRVPEKKVPAEKISADGENALRRDRLNFFKRAMDAQKIRFLVQGHQRDDIAESALMRLTRGSGTDGLAAPRRISSQPDGRIFLRPLLDFSKREIIAALEKNKIPWREDATNAGTDCFRNRLRNVVLPILKKSAPFENFARSRELAEEDAAALEFFAEQIFEKIRAARTESAAPEYNFPRVSACRALAFPAVVRRVLWKIFAAEKIVAPAAPAVDALVAAVVSEKEKFVNADGKKIFWNGKGALAFLPENSPHTQRVPDQNFPFPQAAKNGALGKIFCDVFVPDARVSAEIVALSPRLREQIFAGKISPRDEVFLSAKNWVGEKIFLREKISGERFRPLGAPGTKKIGDILTDKKIPRSRRDALPVFADGAGAAWIPGLPPAHRLKISDADGAALRLTYRRDALPL